MIDEAIEWFGGQPHFLYPEMPLLKGDLLLAVSGPDAAEPWFQRAFDVGGAVGARMSQLRAATRLTRLWRAAGTQPGGSDLLRAIYDTFTEGWDTADLVDARAALDESPGHWKAQEEDGRHAASGCPDGPNRRSRGCGLCVS